MSCFKLPLTTCREIASTMADFWWKNNKGSRGMHWKSWQELTKSKNEGGLGFKDIETFNLTLLGKQLWRMLTQPQTLMAKIYKARYFPTNNLLLANLRSRPSFAWRGIHASQHLMNHGARRTIGNGASTSIWQDNWIGRKRARPVQEVRRNLQHQRQSLCLLNKVQDLMMQGTREWNMPLIRDLFTDETCQQILQITPGGSTNPDSYAWDYTRNGNYTGKSGYWVLTELKKQDPLVYSQPSLDAIYQKIWKVKAAPKIKHFLWKVLGNCLPLAGNLTYRHLAKDASCLRCGAKTECRNHLLFQCPLARLAWAISGIPTPSPHFTESSIYGNLDRMLTLHCNNKEDQNTASIIPWLMWRIWKNRNNLCYNGHEFNAEEMVRKAKEDADEWSIRQEKVSATEKENETRDENRRWKPPPEGWIKCNIDGSYNHNREFSGLGWIIRDSTGKARWMGCKAIPRKGSALETEAEALRWSIQMMLHLGYQMIIFESDSQALVKVLNDQEDWPLFHQVCHDIYQSLPAFEGVKMIFTRREGNGVADRIVKEASSLQEQVTKLYFIMSNWVSKELEDDNPRT